MDAEFLEVPLTSEDKIIAYGVDLADIEFADGYYREFGDDVWDTFGFEPSHVQESCKEEIVSVAEKRLHVDGHVMFRPWDWHFGPMSGVHRDGWSWSAIIAVRQLGKNIVARVVEGDVIKRTLDLEDQMLECPLTARYRISLPKGRILFDKFLTTQYQTIASNLSLDDVVDIRALLQGGMMAAPAIARVCRLERSSSDLKMQLQIKCEDWLKCVHITLRQEGEDAVARADWAAYAALDRDYGNDFSQEINRLEMIPVVTSAEANGYGVSKLFLLTKV